MAAKKKSLPAASPAEGRLPRGRSREGALFTAAPTIADLPETYPATLGEIKRCLLETRLRTVVAANSAMILTYWEIGQLILTRQKSQGWGAKVIDRLSLDLREAFPDMQGLSPRNLKYMRSFAAAWPDPEIVQRAIAQLPWRQNIALLDKLDEPSTRLWYAQQAGHHGWSHTILTLQIQNRLYERQAKAANNFALTMPPAHSDMATQIFKDPYLFDFLGTADPRREREVEQALVDHVQRFLLELGAGFAFVGRQVHLEVGDQDFYLDLLFYHLKLRRYIVIELKAVPFEAEFTGQLGLYLAATDDLLNHQDDQPAIGLLLCKGKNKVVVEYALRGMASPMGVANWETMLTDTLPDEFKGVLPSVKEIEAGVVSQPSDCDHIE